mmetsp:Transcript_49320/g.107378  ORF Transcript_49320/g.107378 Transcript_49320/m.107378 type:complete len:520 (-) Transcript_49320:228-1787(-)
MAAWPAVQVRPMIMQPAVLTPRTPGTPASISSPHMTPVTPWGPPPLVLQQATPTYGSPMVRAPPATPLSIPPSPSAASMSRPCTPAASYAPCVQGPLVPVDGKHLQPSAATHTQPRWTKAALTERLRSKLVEDPALIRGTTQPQVTPRNSFAPAAASGHASVPLAARPAWMASGQEYEAHAQSNGPLSARHSVPHLRGEHLVPAQVPNARHSVPLSMPHSGAEHLVPQSRGEHLVPTVASASPRRTLGTRSSSLPPRSVARFSSAPAWRSAQANQLDVLTEQSLASRGPALALQSDNLRMEKQRFRRAQEHNQSWLKRALGEQLNMFKEEMDQLQLQKQTDTKRSSLLEQKRQYYERAVQAKREAREVREYQNFENKLHIERRRRAEHDAMLNREDNRQERLAQERAAHLQELSAHAQNEAQRHQAVCEEAERIAEERRHRIAEQSRTEDEKAQILLYEKKRLMRLRKEMQVEATQAWEMVKDEIRQQRVSSCYKAKQLETQVDSLTHAELYSPEFIES